MLTSDIEAADEAALLARDADALRAEVLLVPHHGSKTSSTPAFITAVGAAEAIFPVGYRNRFGHPKPEVVARYEAKGSRLWRSDRDGAVQVELSPAGVAIRLAAGVSPLLARPLTRWCGQPGKTAKIGYCPGEEEDHAIQDTKCAMHQPIRAASNGLYRVGQS